MVNLLGKNKWIEYPISKMIGVELVSSSLFFVGRQGRKKRFNTRRGEPSKLVRFFIVPLPKRTHLLHSPRKRIGEEDDHALVRCLSPQRPVGALLKEGCETFDLVVDS